MDLFFLTRDVPFSLLKKKWGPNLNRPKYPKVKTMLVDEPFTDKINIHLGNNDEEIVFSSFDYRDETREVTASETSKNTCK